MRKKVDALIQRTEESVRKEINDRVESELLMRTKKIEIVRTRESIFPYDILFSS